MGFIVTKTKSFLADAAIAKHLRVKGSGTQVTLAGLADNDIGTTEYATFAANDGVAVNLRSGQGTELVVAAGEIARWAKVYTAASGRVSATAAGTSYLRGIAMEAATAAGDIIEILPVFTNVAES